MKETEAIRVVASADRQLLLHELLRKGGEATQEELSRRVAAGRHQVSPNAISDGKVHRAHVRLAHEHLPLLRELNVVEVDGDTVMLSDEERTKWIEAAEMLELWPPDDQLLAPPS